MLSIKTFFREVLNRSLTIKHGLILLVLGSIIYFIPNLFKSNSFFDGDPGNGCDTCGVGITDLVRKVKKELVQLEDSMVNNNEGAMFQLRDMELEISFVVRQSMGGKMGASYEVVTVEGSKEKSNEKIQRLILHWDAQKAGIDTSYNISDVPLDNSLNDKKNKQ